jgi:hypothetical protein
MVKERDRGWKALTEMLKRMAKAGHYAKAGVMERTAQRPDADLTNVELAVIHEFGTDTVPERSFIRAPYEANRPEYERQAAVAIAALLESQGKLQPKDVLAPIAMKMASDMQAYILDGKVQPPDAPATLERKAKKGSQSGQEPVTLVDSSKLLHSITWEAK